MVDTNEFDADDLRRDILDGPYHSAPRGKFVFVFFVWVF